MKVWKIFLGVLFLGNFVGVVLAENVAPLAKVSANSEYNEQYSAKFAVDGVIPQSNSGQDDFKHCWCVQNDTAKNYGEFILQWDQPVDVAEIVYWGRTSFFASECWKDYQVFFDNRTEPVAQGKFQMKHGHQRIIVPKQKTQKIKLVFNNSYGGPNPGAAEIMVFTNSPTDSELRKLDGNALEVLADSDDKTQDFLTHNLNKFLVIKRFEIRSSHVYTYHYEGFRAGGGLYVFDCDELKKNPNAEGKLLVPTPEGQILDADLSHDGNTILFSWRR
ncbi:MAG: hypothetical protein LBK06_02250, partial [Planctomycetaceae bacterium]|nr:hypothetical protein [Planctomycetaceae bacterium]